MGGRVCARSTATLIPNAWPRARRLASLIYWKRRRGAFLRGAGPISATGMDHASVVALTKAKAAAPPVKPLTGRTESERHADEARILLGQPQHPHTNAARLGLGVHKLGARRGSRHQR